MWFEQFNFEDNIFNSKNTNCYLLDMFENGKNDEETRVRFVLSRSLIISESKRLTSFAVANILSRLFPNSRFTLKSKEFFGENNTAFVLGFKSDKGGKRIIVTGTPSNVNRGGEFFVYPKLTLGDMNFDYSRLKKKYSYAYYRTTEFNPNGDNALRPAALGDFTKYGLIDKGGSIY
ncbi:hypothetical protein AGMMS49975_26900 [Clostridia bacterium]|nr:hypothetical protein AGMMS49975_26900 [Clostridia bacterium]